MEKTINIQNINNKRNIVFYAYIKGYPIGVIIGKNKNTYSVQFSQLNNRIISISKDKCLIYDNFETAKANHPEEYIAHIPLKKARKIFSNFAILSNEYHPLDNNKIVKIEYISNISYNDDGKPNSITIVTLYGNDISEVNNYKLIKQD